MTTLNVNLGERSYPIVIGDGLLESRFDLAAHIAGPDCLVVTNTTVGPLYADKLAGLFGARNVQTLELPDGEEYKTPDTAGKVIDQLVAMGAGRDVTVVALGGGVIGDVTGFAAATYMRGVSFIQVPTTLLAQVDSSVGGKTGVNHPGGKNLVGAFHQPKLVLIDTSTLSTLPDRELSAGMAEIIKHGAIADAEYFAWLEQNMGKMMARDPVALGQAIARSCEIKAEVVAEDEREAGIRALLNFGHTFGHAIENSLGYGEWLHGEAVAAGMQMAARMSEIDDADRERLRNLTAAAGLPTDPPGIGADKMRNAMKLDKKVTANTVRLVLLKSLGQAFLSTDYSRDELDRVLALADG